MRTAQPEATRLRPYFVLIFSLHTWDQVRAAPVRAWDSVGTFLVGLRPSPLLAGHFQLRAGELTAFQKGAL